LFILCFNGSFVYPHFEEGATHLRTMNVKFVNGRFIRGEPLSEKEVRTAIKRFVGSENKPSQTNDNPVTEKKCTCNETQPNPVTGKEVQTHCTLQQNPLPVQPTNETDGNLPPDATQDSMNEGDSEPVDSDDSDFAGGDSEDSDSEDTQVHEDATLVNSLKDITLTVSTMFNIDCSKEYKRALGDIHRGLY
jgi:hypothetical protein